MKWKQKVGMAAKQTKAADAMGALGAELGLAPSCEETAALFSQPRLCNWLMVLSAAVAAAFCVVFIELECGVMARAETPIALKHTVKIGLKLCTLGCCFLFRVVPVRSRALLCRVKSPFSEMV